ncbi:T9SS type A sorting domain-containing protein [Lutibacter holmesii]|uniref:T9SS type A sorting domain-containing protein n=1 Tax=Lutibacter holmesii TaxID=1137985 RepID=A0ABW3WPT4_9FLAO
MKQNYIVLICLIFISSNSFFGQIVNEGELQITEYTVVYFGDEYTNKSAANHNNNGSLHLNHNFINNGYTASTSGTTYFNSATNVIQTISGSSNECSFYNLEIDNSLLGVTVTDNFGLFVTNEVVLTNGDLRLFGEAQLLQENNVENSGTGSLLRDQQGTSSTYAYNYWSSPVTNVGSFKLNGGLFDGTDFELNPFSPKQILFNSGSPYNGVPSVIDVSGSVLTAATINETWLYTYSPNSSGYGGWDKINKNSELAPGIGYSMKGTGASSQNYTYKGIPNNGNYNSPFINEGETILLGNPYPSALNVSTFITENVAIINQVNFWIDGGSNSHVLASYKGGYATRNNLAGAPPVFPEGISDVGDAAGKIPGEYIAVGQGFFVKATGDGEIAFTNSQREFETEKGDSEFLKSTKETEVADLETNLLEKSIVRIGYKDPSESHRQIVLGFVPNSTADMSFNPGYDAFMVDPRDDELFFIIENDLTKKYIIQAVGNFDYSYKIPLGLLISEVGEHMVMLDGVENFTETVYVFDKVLNKTYVLNEEGLRLNLPVGSYLDRFQLVFESVVLEKNQNTEELASDQSLKVYCNKYQNIVINNQTDLEVKEVQVFNTIGQQLIQVKTEMFQTGNNYIPFNYPKGVYLINIHSNKGLKSYKVIN